MPPPNLLKPFAFCLDIRAVSAMLNKKFSSTVFSHREMTRLMNTMNSP